MRGLALALVLALCWPAAVAATATAAGTPPGLMVHVPLDGTVTDARGLGAVRADAEGSPAFIPGRDGEAALPAPGQRHVGLLHVSRLSRLLLRGRTPQAGTIMLWVTRPAAPASEDSATVVVLSSDAPLHLEVAIGRGSAGGSSQLVAAFDDDAGNRHTIAAPVAAGESWVHLALGWDAKAGVTVAFVGGAAAARDTGSAFTMPKLPRFFALGAPDLPIDDFRLYDRLLDPAALHTLPGFTTAP